MPRLEIPTIFREEGLDRLHVVTLWDLAQREGATGSRDRLGSSRHLFGSMIYSKGAAVARQRLSLCSFRQGASQTWSKARS